MARPTSFEEFLAVEQLTEDTWTTKFPTETNSPDPTDLTAYGGCTLAIAIRIGYATVQDNFRLYSCLGQFGAPAIAGLTLQARVAIIRESQSFVSRRVEVLQNQNQDQDLQSRNNITSTSTLVASMQMDFQAMDAEPPLVTFQALPTLSYSPAASSWTVPQMRQHALTNGVPEKFLKILDKAMQARKRYFDVRSPPEAFTTTTMHGVFPHLEGANQKERSTTDKTSCYYWKSFGPLRSPASNAAAMGFVLDAGMAITAVSFAKIPQTRVDKVTSLDFALRMHANEVDVTDWVMREERVVVAGEGRSFCEARVWDARGRLVATMSEQCLMRGKRKSDGKGRDKEKEVKVKASL